MTSNSDNSIRQPFRVGIWCAVSSKPQAADDKVSLSVQEDAGRRFAQSIGGQVVAVYTVPGHSRDIIFYTDAEKQMDAYRQLREDIEAGRLDVLHTIAPDRLGRDPALAQQVLSLVEKNGAEVYCASNPHIIGQKGAGSRYTFAIQATRAGEDQQRRIEYLRQGMKKRQERGLHANNWPYGYRPIYDGGKKIGAEFDDTQIAAVQLITERFLEGATYEDIAQAVQAAGYRPPRTKRNKWDKTTIRRMLENPFYAGYVRYSGQASDTPSPLFPALWDADTFEAVQRELEYRQNRFGRRIACSMFNQVVFCARCGSVMHRGGRTKSHSKYVPAYICIAHKREHNCHANTTTEVKIIDALTQYLAGFLDDAAIDNALTGSDRRTALIDRIADLDRQIDAINKKRERIALAFASEQMDVGIYRRTDDILTADLDSLADQRRQHTEQLNALPTAESRRNALIQIRDLAGTFFDLDPAHINALLRAAGIVVLCENRWPVKIEIGL